MANKNDIINAINYLDNFLQIQELRGAKVKKNQNGQPYFFAGGFNMVFQVEINSTKWAFRVWHINFNKLKVRFQKISNYLKNHKLPYFSDFIYDEDGLLVNGKLIDTVRMSWIDGLLLKDFIKANLNNKQTLLDLAELFCIMCSELHKNQISHGDLQHGNIIVDYNNKIRLIDYDSICVPEIEGEEELITGLKGYQHPSRFNSNNTTSLKADYFSELIIYLSIIAFAEKPSLWNNFNVEESEVLLFCDEDFEDFQHSRIYSELSNNCSVYVKTLLAVLSDYLKTSSYLDIAPLESYLTPPEIVSFNVDKSTIISGQEIILSWHINNAYSVKINNGIGSNLALVDTKSVQPSQNTTFRIEVTGLGGTTFRDTTVKVFPTPIIESLIVPIPDFSSRINLNSININPPNIDLSVNLPEFKINLPEFTTSNIALNKITPVYKTSKSNFNFSKLYERLTRKNRI